MKTFLFSVAATFSVYGMDSGSFNQLKDRIEREGFSDSKFSVIRSAAPRNTFTSDQVAEVMDLFSFSADKIKALSALRTRIEDPQNSYVIVERFNYDKDKKDAAGLLEGIESALPKPPRTRKRTVCWGSGAGKYCYTEYFSEE
nr:hypothetical protein CH379_14575 [Leptospira ellisii]